MPEYHVEESGPDHAEDLHRRRAGRRRGLRRRHRPQQEGSRAAGRRGGLDRAISGRQPRAPTRRAEPAASGRELDARAARGRGRTARPRALGRRPDDRRAEVLHPRAVRRHLPGADDFAARLTRPHGRPARAPRQVPVAAARTAATTRCSPTSGMSGQLLVVPAGRAAREAPAGPVRASPTAARSCASSTSAPSVALCWSPTSAATACRRRSRTSRRDPLDPPFDEDGVRGALRAPADRGQARAARPVADQRRRQHLRRRGAVAGAAALRPADRDADPAAGRRAARPPPVRSWRAALAEGGTSFDSLYVNVNGETGYFDRSLDALRPRGRALPRAAARRSAASRS